MALREETFGTMGTRLHDVLGWAGVTGREVAPLLKISEASVTRLRSKGDDISSRVVQLVSQYCAGKGMLEHLEWTQLRSFILDGGKLPGPEFLFPSEAPSGGGGLVIPIKGESSDDILYCRQRAS